jgi:hypothetical protein
MGFPTLFITTQVIPLWSTVFASKNIEKRYKEKQSQCRTYRTLPGEPVLGRLCLTIGKENDVTCHSA